VVGVVRVCVRGWQSIINNRLNIWWWACPTTTIRRQRNPPRVIGGRREIMEVMMWV
jgi:hypothetical protein